MKKLIVLTCVLMIATSCNKNKVKNNEYISECAHITKVSHPSMTQRNDACKTCCQSNDFETGMYDEGMGASQEGCECFDKP